MGRPRAVPDRSIRGVGRDGLSHGGPSSRLAHLMIREDYGVPENDAEAVRWYRLVAEQGYASAQTSLGVMYVIGDGVPEDSVRQLHVQRNLSRNSPSTPAPQGPLSLFGLPNIPNGRAQVSKPPMTRAKDEDDGARLPRHHEQFDAYPRRVSSAFRESTQPAFCFPGERK